jgi:hypothetical protein
MFTDVPFLISSLTLLTTHNNTTHSAASPQGLLDLTWFRTQNFVTTSKSFFSSHTDILVHHLKLHVQLCYENRKPQRVVLHKLFLSISTFSRIRVTGDMKQTVTYRLFSSQEKVPDTEHTEECVECLYPRDSSWTLLWFYVAYIRCL